MRATRRHSAHFRKDGLSVSTRTVRRRISDGTIPAHTIGRSGTIRIRLDELEAAVRPMASARLRPVRSGHR